MTEASATAGANSELVSPFGGTLIDLTVPSDDVASTKERASSLPSSLLSERAKCDLELLASGAFSPLDRFLGAEDYRSVLGDMRLSSGHLFPVPVTLSVDPDTSIRLDGELALRDSRNELLAVMTVEEAYDRDVEEEAMSVLGTLDPRHPLVAEMHRWGRTNISGRLRVIKLPTHFDFRDLRLTPRETRMRLEEQRAANVVAFQTRNPLHRVHEELTKRAAAEIDGTLLLHPVVGMTRPGDVDHFTRVRTYRAFVESYYDSNRVVLSLLPLAMRMAGPREAVWHALIRRNYGANHFIVGRDHAGPGLGSDGKPFYGPYEAQDLVKRHEQALGVKVVPFRELVYLPNENRYEEVTKIPADSETASLSGTQVRDEYLARGRELPSWFTRPEVARIMADTYPPRHRQGVCVWFTGLSGAGKTTTADVLTDLLMEHGRQVTVLDGDVVRTHLSKGLGFSKEDRDTNILRIGFVAAEIARHGGVAVLRGRQPVQRDT